MAASGLFRRWKEHYSASMICTHVHRASRFYTTYPNSNCDDKNLRNIDSIKGKFQQLEPLIGIGFNRSKKEDINSYCSKSEEYELELLSISGKNQTLEDKKYRHLCYMFEKAYGLEVEPHRNISNNPGCEWQLRFYGE